MKFLVAVLFYTIAVVSCEKLDVTVYYESFCPDSRAFITKQLAPAYNDIKDEVNIKFIPFGKSQSKDANGDLFECHHGQKECAGNKLHSCGLENLKSKPDAQVKFVDCQMKAFESDPSGKQCAEASGADWAEVSKCIANEAGKQLQLRAEADTQALAKPWPKNIPTIVFNKKFEQNKQDRSLTDFKAVVCESLPTPNPGLCAK